MYVKLQPNFHTYTIHYYTVTTKFSFLCIATISAKEAPQVIAKIPKGLLLASLHLLFLQPLFKGG